MGFYLSGGGGAGFSPNQLDAFSRLRVSQETTLLELKQTNDQAPDFLDILTAGTAAVEVHYGATDGSNTVTGGSRIAGGYIKANDTTSKDLITSDRLGALIDGTATRFYLCVEPLSVNLDIYGEVDWRESV